MTYFGYTYCSNCGKASGDCKCENVADKGDIIVFDGNSTEYKVTGRFYEGDSDVGVSYQDGDTSMNAWDGDYTIVGKV